MSKKTTSQKKSQYRENNKISDDIDEIYKGNDL